MSQLPPSTPHPAARLVKIYEDGHAALFPLHFICAQWAVKLQDKAGDVIRNGALVFQNGGVSWYNDPHEQTRIAKLLLDKMLDGYYATVRDNSKRGMDDVQALSAELEKTDFASKSTPQLVAKYREYCARVLEMNAWGTIVTLLEMGVESVITDATRERLTAIGKTRGLEKDVPAALGDLTSPVTGTFLRDKNIAVLRAAITAQGKPAGINDAGVQHSIDEIHARYAWVSYGYTGPEFSRGQLQAEVEQAAANPHAAKELDELLTVDERTKAKALEWEKHFAFTPADSLLFELARTLMVQKELRKQVMYRSFYAIRPLRAELAKRASIELEDFAFILPAELEDVLSGKLPAAKLAERRQLCVYRPFQNEVLSGKAARDFVAHIPARKIDLNARELKGAGTFFAPPVRGTVRLVFTAHDLHKLKDGDILVSPATSPSMVVGMKRAGAIVTNQGGLTCHAAIVSRELGVPCVIGTRVATEVLKDGEVVEVDAEKGVVRRFLGHAQPGVSQP